MAGWVVEEQQDIMVSSLVLVKLRADCRFFQRGSAVVLVATGWGGIVKGLGSKL